MQIIRKVTLLTALIVAVWAVLPPAGLAQVDLPPVLEPTQSPTPKPSSSPTPTATPKPKPRQTSGTTTTKKKSSGSTSPRSSSRTATVDPVVQEGLTLWREREKSPARTTTRLLELIQQAHTARGKPTFPEMRDAFGRFPIVGYTWYQDDYGAPRFSPYYSSHAGNDLFAERGTPVIAVTDGFIWRMGSFSKGGNAIWLMGDDNVRYYYGHMDSLAKGLKTNDRVKQGQLIGTVGNTGNAVGTYPHVHFEINPGGLGTVDPKPILDRWLDNAEATIVARLGGSVARAPLTGLGAARWSRLIDLFAEPGAQPSVLWAAGIGGSGALLASLDTGVWELLAAYDLEVLAPIGAGGNDVMTIDPLAGLLADARGDTELDLGF